MITLPHGGALDVIAKAFPKAPLPWVDLSTGINPFPYPLDINVQETLAHLPREEHFKACSAAMAHAWSANPKYICPTPGSEWVIRHLPKLLLRTQSFSPGNLSTKRIGLAEFSYTDHQQAWQQAGCDILMAKDPITLTQDVDILVIVNPNNPDGHLYTHEQLQQAHNHLQHKGGYLILDEAFIDLTPEHSLSNKAGQPGLIILRSTGKFYGLPGLRLAALLAEHSIISSWNQFAGHWSVSGFALAAGEQIYADLAWPKHMRTKLSAKAKQLKKCLQTLKIKCVGNTDLFFLIEVSDAKSVWHHLATQGIYTRYFENQTDCLRLGLPATEQELERLATTLKI
ncbi:MAG: threonine-phosphate decarboxylase CobD [Pseudomonadota bacterium]